MTDSYTDNRESSDTPLALPRSEPEHLTRRQAADYIRDVLGRPFSFSTATKLAALGEFAQPVLWWGRRPLYRPADLRAWAEARSRPTKESAVREGTNRIATQDEAPKPYAER